MTLVERFIDFSDWPTSRKTAIFATIATAAQLLTTGWILLLRPAALNMPMMARLVLCGAAILGVNAAIGWITYWRGKVGRWTGYLLVGTFFAWIFVFTFALGSFTTPYVAFGMLGVLLMGLWYDARMGVATLVYAIGLAGLAAVLTLTDAVPYAPVMEIRDIDGLASPSWIILMFTDLGVVAGLSCVLGFGAVAAALLQTRRLAETHARLERAHGLIRRYVPEQVADAVLSDTPEAIERHERRKLTVFFSDLVGFTDLSDEMEPEDLAKVLHDYFTEMSAVARKYAGTVDDLIGDAVLVFFGAPDFTDDHDQALRAVRMAMEMQEVMGSLNERWAAAGIPESLVVRMGINTGLATVGNFGSAERTKYTALGKQVNIAARIQSQCEPGQVLIGHTTWLLVRDEIACIPKGELDLKGLRKPMAAYEVQA